MLFLKRFFRYGLRKKPTEEEAQKAYPELYRALSSPPEPEKPAASFSADARPALNRKKAPVMASPMGGAGKAAEHRLECEEAQYFSFVTAIADEVSEPPEESLAERLAGLDASFSEKLFTLIDERALRDADVYKAAHLDRRLFSKIRSNPDYQPSKPTAVALCFALGLDRAESEALLRSCGYTFSPSSKWDMIVAYYLDMRVYDLDKVNDALYSFDQSILGGY